MSSLIALLRASAHSPPKDGSASTRDDGTGVAVSLVPEQSSSTPWGMTSCSECGFVYEDLAASEIVGVIRHAAREIRERLGSALGEPDGVPMLRTRPEPTTWSALEYAGHVRDVFLTQHGRLYHGLVVDTPEFPSMHRDERVELGAYNEEDPTTTAGEVTMAADLFGRLAQRLTPEQWARACIYVNPVPTERELIWVARHTAHEVLHHLGDIDRVLAAVHPA